MREAFPKATIARAVFVLLVGVEEETVEVAGAVVATAAIVVAAGLVVVKLLVSCWSSRQPVLLAWQTLYLQSWFLLVLNRIINRLVARNNLQVDHL